MKPEELKSLWKRRTDKYTEEENNYKTRKHTNH